MDAISATEYMEWVKPAQLSRTVGSFSSKKRKVTKEEKRHVDSPDEISFWMDRSRLDTGRTRAGIE